MSWGSANCHKTHAAKMGIPWRDFQRNHGGILATQSYYHQKEAYYQFMKPTIVFNHPVVDHSLLSSYLISFSGNFEGRPWD